VRPIEASLRTGDLLDTRPIRVDAHSGCKANERPLQFHFDEEIYEIAAVLDQW
jgi:hypothetical protein